MNLQQLQYFREIVECGQFTKAAERQNVTQSSLSHAISNLEKELGVPLFLREGKTIRLTIFGKAYLKHVETALNALTRGQDELAELTNPDVGTVSLIYLNSINDFIPDLIAEFYQNTGKIQTKFHFSGYLASTIEEYILNGQADIGFSTDPLLPGLASHSFGIQETVVIVSASHPLAQRDSIDLKELKNEKIIMYRSEARIRKYFEKVFHILDFEPNIYMEAYEQVILGMVAANFGVALVPDMHSLAFYPIKVLKIDNPLPPRELKIIYAKNRTVSAAAYNFRKYLLENNIHYSK